MKRTNPFDHPSKQNKSNTSLNKEINDQQIHNNPPPKDQPPQSNQDFPPRVYRPETNQETRKPPNAFPHQTRNYQNQETQLNPFQITMKEYESVKQFNCSSEFLCPTTSVLPSNNNILCNLSFPIGLSISPLTQSVSSNEIPEVTYGDNNIPRCASQSCRGYVNPFVKWIQGGEKWICNLCKYVNDTENFYYSEIDQFGKRTDLNSRPELINGSYEFLANKTYWKKDKTPSEAFFIFMIETSSSAINSGFLTAVIEGIKGVIDDNLFFNRGRTKVAFITYDIGTHFYSFNNKINQPQIHCVADDPVFLPTIIDNLIFSVENHKERILSILEMIQKNFNGQYITCKDSNLIFNAINGAYLLAKGKGGKVVIFSASNTLTINPKMCAGLDPKMTKEQMSYTTLDKKQLGNMGIVLTNENICCDIFATAEKDTNILTLNQLCEYSNGQIYYYKSFKFEVHYKNIYNQIRRVFSRSISWEGVLRTRFSHGYRISEFLTPVLLTNKDLFVFPTNDSDQHYQISIDIAIQEGQELNNLTINDQFVYIQSALLYSYGDGSRRIRIHNLCLPVSSSTQDIYLGVNAEALAVCYFKQTIDKIYKTKNITNSIISTETLFKTFISNILDNQMAMQKELPENLLNLPLYILGMIKHRVFSKDEIERKYSIDLSNYLRIKLQRTSIEETLSFIFPRIYPLHLLITDKTYGVYEESSGILKIPDVLSAHSSSFEADGLYLIDNGYLLILYIHLGINKEICKSLFEVEDLQFLAMNVSEDTVFDYEKLDEFKERIMNIVDSIRSYKSLFQNMIFVFEKPEGDKIIHECLIEDNCCPWYPIDYYTFYSKAIGTKMKKGMFK